ncbi:uncharacterized protein LOC116377972 isoform X1 [Anarrhichthys ocellatus]|uniref:uncharacterized protein LOC116377972 isoform X1 n=1 Tax=Anarrhichthys ocellatus TaxID=433405 RepID=UPI0012ECBF4A|nr:uncharacterized protein LOC116377972 isoform X1 [Anarrhichthys ocellatus]
MMPASSHQPRILATRSLGPTEGCFVSKAVLGYYSSYAAWASVNSTMCAKTHPTQRYRGSSATSSQFQASHVQYAPHLNFSFCFARNGSKSVGQLHPSMCNVTFIGATFVQDKDYSRFGDTSNHPAVTVNDTVSVFYRLSCANSSGNITAASIRRCMQLARLEDCTLVKDCTRVPFYLQRFSYDGWKHVARDTVDCPAGVKCSLAHYTVVPGKKGTYPVTGGWWLCGHTVYAALPPDWDGVCAPVSISDHTVIISAVPKTRFSRDLVFKKHDSVWGSDVPDEFKHWSVGSKVGISLLPWVGVAKNTLRLET